MSLTATLCCPICTSPDIYVHRVRGGVIYYKCNTCSNIFSNPIIIPDNLPQPAVSHSAEEQAATDATQAE